MRVKHPQRFPKNAPRPPRLDTPFGTEFIRSRAGESSETDPRPFSLPGPLTAKLVHSARRCCHQRLPQSSGTPQQFNVLTRQFGL